jgi:hypothetical protein
VREQEQNPDLRELFQEMSAENAHKTLPHFLANPVNKP